MVGIRRHSRSRGHARQFIGKAVVHIPMMGFIRTDSPDHVPQSRCGGQLSIMPGDRWRRGIGAPAFVDLLEIEGVADHRFFLKIAHHAVRCPRAHQISAAPW